ncbi:MAG: hypothetical protein IT370_31250 [Deltaproteobacteria bacterium]|nr:hypothetical protein [Deltaproteobacteria bacterium]
MSASNQQLTRAVIVNEDDKGGKPIEVHFNPKELTIDKPVAWTPHPTAGVAVPKLEFTSGSAKSLSVELLLDCYEGRAPSVNTMVRKLEKLGTPSTVNGKWRPPLCTFVWGDQFPQFRGVIESIQVKYTMFRETGEPVRATVALKIKEANEIDGKAPGKNHRQAAEEQDCDDARDARVA